MKDALRAPQVWLRHDRAHGTVAAPSTSTLTAAATTVVVDVAIASASTTVVAATGPSLATAVAADAVKSSTAMVQADCMPLSKEPRTLIVLERTSTIGTIG